MTAVAVVGLGAMGGRIAGRLLAAGHELAVWNRTPARAEPLAALGATVAATPRAAAAGAELAVTMLADPEALVAATEGPDGVAAGLRPGATLLEMSTVGPAALARLAAALPGGANLLDVPVLGSVSEAEAGTLRLFVGGEPGLVERWTPLLRTLGEPLHVGPLGSGAAAKLVANAALLGTIALLGETLALADALGLARERAFDVLAATPLAAQAERRRPALESGEYPARFRLALARKDAELIRFAAEGAGLPVPTLEAVRGRFAEAEAAGLGDEDYAAVLARILAPPA